MNIKFLYSTRRVLLALIFSLSVAGLSVQGARAATYTVTILDDSGAGSLRQAILDANATPGIPDTITFSVSGMVTLGSNLPRVTGDLTINGSGQNITISGNDLYQVLYISPGRAVTLNRLTIVHGHRGGTLYGGGIYNDHGTLTVTNCTISNNTAYYGGGIYTDSGTLTVANSTFSGNSVGKGGGGIYSNSTLTVTNSTFFGNHAHKGGGIFNMGGPMTLANSTFFSNSANKGGGVINMGGLMTMTNCSISNNHADNGGGLYSYVGALTVTNSTFSGNSATYGGGIENHGSLSRLKNNILANSTSGVDCLSDRGLVTDIDNLIERNSGCGMPVSSADPLLGPLAPNGGPTRTFSLQAGSPAIDAGDDATCAATPVNNLDQRGVTRSFGAHCDIGSFEKNNGSLTARSVGTYDGHILESGETTNVGGTRDSTSTTFNLGDGAGDKQYRAVLSFNTASLPDTAVITKVTLKIKRPATGFLVGNNSPFTWGLGLKVDVCRTFFGTTVALQLGDFNFTNATNCKLLVGTFGGTPVASWYSANILSTAFTRINKIGATQFRLRFYKDDNDDGGADYTRFYSGNYRYPASRPMLVIEYYVPVP